MMKKMLCVLLAMLLCPVLALAEESTAAPLSYQELVSWAASFQERAVAAQPLNTPADSLTADGYEFVYEFATLYADTPHMSTDSVINVVVLTAETENGPRNVNVNNAMSVVLDAYYTENHDLAGTEESAVLYTSDALPESAAWAQVLRDGQRVQTIQYAVHDQLGVGGEGYTDAGVIYTMAENRVSAVRVYGLSSRASLQEVNDVLYNLSLTATEQSYAQVPFSYDGAELTAFSQADLTFSGIDFLNITPDAAIELLGEPVSDTWVDNEEDGYIRKQVFAACELTYLFNRERTQGSVYMLSIEADGLEGPRAVRYGDTFSSVYNRFRNGEGEYQEDGREVLYGSEDALGFGQATYGTDASAKLRYGFTLSDGRKVVLHMDFTVMELTQIMLYVR